MCATSRAMSSTAAKLCRPAVGPSALAGMPQGGEFQVNTYTTDRQRYPSVAMDADGDFVVIWQSHGTGGTDVDRFSIQGQSRTAAGTPVGSQLQVNTYTADRQHHPSVAMDADGDFVAAWQSYGSGGTDSEPHSILAQRYLWANPATATPTPTSTPTPQPSTPLPPTAVDLRSFLAIGLPDRAILVWETASEADTLGFQVLRAAGAAGPWTPVGPAFIPAQGGAASGRSYVLRDAPGPGTWYYRLEDVGADGKRGAHLAAPVRVGPDATGSAVFVPSAATGPR